MTPTEVAAWMLQEISKHGILYQDEAVSDIEKLFGKQFVYCNENGNLAINKAVLAAFREISRDEVVWESGDRLWRKRAKFDEPGRSQR